MPQTAPLSLSAGVASSGSQNAVTASPGGWPQSLVGVPFIGTAQAVTSGTSASSLVPTGVGPSGATTPTVPANYMVPGKTIRCRIVASVTTQATQGTTNFVLSLGSSTIYTSPAVSLPPSLTQAFKIEILITCLTAGAGGTCSFFFESQNNNGTIAPIYEDGASSGFGVSLNTTVANLLAVTSTNSVAGGTVFTVNSFIVESLN